MINGMPKYFKCCRRWWDLKEVMRRIDFGIHQELQRIWKGVFAVF